MSERKIKVIKLIYDNPGLSGNELYKKSMSQGYGIKKQDFYQTIRTIRKLPEPTIEKKERATPIKYRKPIPKIKKEYVQLTLDQIRGVKKEGSYKVVEVIMDGESFYIKYKTRKQFDKHLKKLKKAYSHKEIIFNYLGKRFYTQFRTDEFIKLLAKSGL